jgi:hypothetical protein
VTRLEELSGRELAAEAHKRAQDAQERDSKLARALADLLLTVGELERRADADE